MNRNIHIDRAASSGCAAGIIQIEKAASAFEIEPLQGSFGFKGSSLSRLWQTVVRLTDRSGKTVTGLGVQSVLWSDPDVYSAHGEERGNELMYRTTQRALQLIEGAQFSDPFHLTESIFQELYDYACEATGLATLRKTFVLNALVPVDNAAWLLFGYARGLDRFETMVPEPYRAALPALHRQVASVPTIGYGSTDDSINQLLDDRFFLLKIKTGHPGSQEEMLEKDSAFFSRVHQLAKDRGSAYTPGGRILYYVDANGRYENRETLERFLDHAQKIGAFDRILLLEEPFPYESETEVSGLGLRIAADESVCTENDVIKCLQMGYAAVALKPTAKTMSMTLKALSAAASQGLSCFCADLTANPVLVEWNKNLAARLESFPGLKFNFMETNGRQNYRNWETMRSYNPSHNFSWTQECNGLFGLDEEYYRESGGIFQEPSHYEHLFNNSR